jgi:branched-chain amino acid aminotransferase
MISVSIDGVLGPPEQARISIFDRAFLYGDGLFEVLRTWDEQLVDVSAHLDRLFASAHALAIRMLDRDRLTEAVHRTLANSGPGGEKRVRIIVTRGPGALLARPDTLGPGKTIIIVEPLPAQPTELSLAVVDWPLPRRASPAHKTLAYLDHIIARDLAAAAGADEAIRLGPEGDVLECASSNVFLVMGETVLTPLLRGVLPGVTRARVLEACASLAIVATEARLTLEELRGASEIFVTSALRGVVPVTRLDGEPRPAGAVTAQIAHAVHAHLVGRTVGPPTDPI